jgi:hypothetical protein
MNKYEALHKFWSSFGVEAYDENTVPDDAKLPYITYSVSVGSFDYPVSATVSIFDRSMKWVSVTEIANRIENALKNGGVNLDYDDGTIWVRMGTPWAQRLSDVSNDTIRRIVLNLEVEFIS